jgi:hypothetical protein
MAGVRLLRQQVKDANRTNDRNSKAYQSDFDAYLPQVDAYNAKVGAYNAAVQAGASGELYYKPDGSVGVINNPSATQQSLLDTRLIQSDGSGGFVAGPNYNLQIRGTGLIPGTEPAAPAAPTAVDPKFTEAELRRLRTGGESAAGQQMAINNGRTPVSQLAGDEPASKGSVFYDKDKALADQGILTRTLAGQLGKW